MKEEMRTIGYLCPACRKRVIQSRSVFALSASGAVVSFECGESSLTIDVARLAAVRKAVGDDVCIRIDANQAWQPKEAVKILN